MPNPKPPSQARSKETVRCIVEAAARVLATGGLTALNTNCVAEVAGVSVGSLYQYFPNKAALLAALIEREAQALAEQVEAVVARCQGLDFAQTLSQLIDVAIAQQFGKPLLAAALDHEESRLQASGKAEPPSPAQVRLVGAVAQCLLAAELAGTAASAQHLALDCLLIAKALIDHEGRVSAECPPGLKPRVIAALTGYLAASPHISS